MKFLCFITGHVLPDKIENVYGNTIAEPRFKDESGTPVLYRCRVCKRCDKRMPISAEDAAEKAKSIAEVSRLMNGARARYGLRPIDWDD